MPGSTLHITHHLGLQIPDNQLLYLTVEVHPFYYEKNLQKKNKKQKKEAKKKKKKKQNYKTRNKNYFSVKAAKNYLIYKTCGRDWLKTETENSSPN